MADASHYVTVNCVCQAEGEDEWQFKGKGAYYRAMYCAARSNHLQCLESTYQANSPHHTLDTTWSLRGILAAAASTNSVATFERLLDLGFEVGNEILGRVALRGHREILESLLERETEKDRELEDVEKVYREIVQKIKHSEDIFKQSEKEVNEIRSGLHEVDLKKAETNYSIDNLNQRIRDVYKLDLGQIQIIEGWEDIKQSQLKAEVDEKREKLERLERRAFLFNSSWVEAKI